MVCEVLVIAQNESILNIYTEGGIIGWCILFRKLNICVHNSFLGRGRTSNTWNKIERSGTASLLPTMESRSALSSLRTSESDAFCGNKTDSNRVREVGLDNYTPHFVTLKSVDKAKSIHRFWWRHSFIEKWVGTRPYGRYRKSRIFTFTFTKTLIGSKRIKHGRSLGPRKEGGPHLRTTTRGAGEHYVSLWYAWIITGFSLTLGKVSPFSSFAPKSLFCTNCTKTIRINISLDWNALFNVVWL